MRGFPWFWERDGDAWAAALHRGGPHGHRRQSGPDEPAEAAGEGARAGRGQRGAGSGPDEAAAHWGPFGRPHGRHQFGGAPFGFPPFGGGRWGGRGGRGGWSPFGGPPFGRGPKVRRGDVRAGILALLTEQPRNGYQIIQEIAERSGGLWKPSSGSVYPALQQLEDEGLVETVTLEGRRTFQLTDAGRRYVEEHKDELAAPWEAVTAGVDDSSIELHALLGQVAMATIQVSQAATPAQLARARQVLIDTRRSLYQLLAEAEEVSED